MQSGVADSQIDRNSIRKNIFFARNQYYYKVCTVCNEICS